ncbi:MAG: Hsp20 family protein [Pseudomonadota bacterium]
MPQLTGFSSPFMLGFDEIERLLSRVSKSAGDGYPPYNIERYEASDDAPALLRITLAVAGFGPDDLDVTVEENQLTIRGKQSDNEERAFLHRGIATRQFQRSFVLAEGLEILGADLKNGLLSIDLAQPEPERVVRRIPIRSDDDQE